MVDLVAMVARAAMVHRVTPEAVGAADTQVAAIPQEIHQVTPSAGPSLIYLPITRNNRPLPR
jgi:hypothetical protein